MSTFKEYINEKKLVDLLDLLKSKKDPSDYWSNGLSYQGQDLFDLYMKNYKMIQDEGRTIMEDYAVITNFDSQEVYFGYCPKEDKFYSGWDCWVTEEIDNPDFDSDDVTEYEDEYIEDDSNGNIICTFNIVKGKIKNMETSTDLSGIFYNNKGSGYDILKKNHKELVDIRLD